jgi:hypothetical protein
LLISWKTENPSNFSHDRARAQQWDVSLATRENRNNISRPIATQTDLEGTKMGGGGHEKNKQLDCVNQHCNKFRATTIEQLRFFLILIKKNQPINRVKYYMN